MRTAVIAIALAMLAASAATAQKGSPCSRAPKKGDAVVVKGCLSGQALEATELGSKDATGALSSGVTFRLTGDKALLRQLRDEHDGKIVDVEGVLKSDLPRESVASRKVGRMRITIGTPAQSPNSQEAATRRSLPVLEVTSYNGSTTTCGR
jgi:hypothetical protein